MCKLYVNFVPDEQTDSFRARMDGPVITIQEMEGEMFVGSDFNAKALECGMTDPDCRGKQVVEMLSRLGLEVFNMGRLLIFRQHQWCIIKDNLQHFPGKMDGRKCNRQGT